MNNTCVAPLELIEQLEKGNVLLFIGEGINQGLLPSSAELAQELARRCEYPEGDPLTLPRVAGYYEMTRNDRHGLVQFLKDRFEPMGQNPLKAHKLAVQLRPRVIITTCYDRLLERALQQSDIAYAPVVGNAEVAYTDDDQVLLVWLWGVLDQPDSVVVTEDDRRRFLEGRANLSDVLRGELARRTWLFIGFDAEDEWFRGFYDSVSRGLDRHKRRSYILADLLSAYTQTWWKNHGAELVGHNIELFLTALVERLRTSSRPSRASQRIKDVSEAISLPNEPYKALAAYEKEDSAMFYGRDSEIETLTSLIHAHRLVLLYGASGVGKTSLLQAGVIPRLEGTEGNYIVIKIRTLENPVSAIQAALCRQIPDFSISDSPLVDLLVAAKRMDDRPIVLIIDQFEEFFIRFGQELREAFINELGRLYEAQDVYVKIVLSLREDYLAHIGEIELRIPEVFQTRMRLTPMTREAAQQAILLPAEALGYTYESSLVNTLLDALFDQGVMPPHLQLVCNALFRNARARDSHNIILKDYQELGGVQGVLRNYLVEELERLPVEERAVVYELLEELVSAEGTKRVETFEELRATLSVDADFLDRLLTKLVNARLIHIVEASYTTEKAIELAHEYLINEIAMDFEVRLRKEAEDLLTRELMNWRALDTLISADRLPLILGHIRINRLSSDARNLLLMSALENNFGAPDLWDQLLEPNSAIEMLIQALKNPFLKPQAKIWAVTTAPKFLPNDEIVEAIKNLIVANREEEVTLAALESLHNVEHVAADMVTSMLNEVATKPLFPSKTSLGQQLSGLLSATFGRPVLGNSGLAQRFRVGQIYTNWVSANGREEAYRISNFTSDFWLRWICVLQLFGKQLKILFVDRKSRYLYAWAQATVQTMLGVLLWATAHQLLVFQLPNNWGIWLLGIGISLLCYVIMRILSQEVILNDINQNDQAFLTPGVGLFWILKGKKMYRLALLYIAAWTILNPLVFLATARQTTPPLALSPNPMSMAIEASPNQPVELKFIHWVLIIGGMMLIPAIKFILDSPDIQIRKIITQLIQFIFLGPIALVVLVGMMSSELMLLPLGIPWAILAFILYFPNVDSAPTKRFLWRLVDGIFLGPLATVLIRLLSKITVLNSLELLTLPRVYLLIIIISVGLWFSEKQDRKFGILIYELIGLGLGFLTALISAGGLDTALLSGFVIAGLLSGADLSKLKNKSDQSNVVLGGEK